MGSNVHARVVDVWGKSIDEPDQPERPRFSALRDGLEGPFAVLVGDDVEFTLAMFEEVELAIAYARIVNTLVDPEAYVREPHLAERRALFKDLVRDIANRRDQYERDAPPYR